jgi:hypothetical protein
MSDLDALRGALKHALDPAADPVSWRLGVRLATITGPIWHRAGLFAEGWQWLQQARLRLDDAQRPSEPSGEDAELGLRLDMASIDSCISTQQGDPHEARRLLDRLMQDPRVTGHAELNFRALRADFSLQVRLGFADPKGGPRAACDALRRACLPTWPELAQRWWIAAEALVRRGAGDYEGALVWMDRHTQLCRRHRAVMAGRIFQLQRMQLLGLLDRWAEARAEATEHAAELQAAGVVRQSPFNLACAAAVLLRCGPVAGERALVLDALRLMAGMQQLWWVADALPWAALHEGRLADALTLQRWADGLVHRRGEPRGPFFGGMRKALMQRLAAEPAAQEVVENALLERAAQTPEADILDLALGTGTGRAVLGP